ncbi:TfuA-like protein [Haliangium ochraceum]|uniref:TfuA domain protein core n=1 Tax=Haliangium ochraceum (strain DSM 14365 / JCM 11303 / SMP-2) TaxID=502025 RepID=D0LNV6_HALO1|nr:TfuA-like protein [Haliangium ochraceum]ACY18782.1 TfuA domain protein core [Haliangium ochraceum DSM 14365]
MSVYVFTGPTLSAERGRAELDAVFLPPCGQGDVYRAALRQPRVIAIIDGYFERVPAVWHKEILWAMSRGVHVFGAASMGALRAAELAAFGMRGIGTIYEDLCSGAITRDDEVAVLHGDADSGFRPLSEALVNIRATLLAAEQAGVLGAEQRARLHELAAAMFYGDRGYPALLARAAEQGAAPESTLRALGDFVSENRVDQKQQDALALLGAVREHLAGEPGRLHVDYAFAHTDAWEQFVAAARRNDDMARAEDRSAGPTADPAAEHAQTRPDDVLVELALAGEYERAREAALTRVLAQEAAARHGVVPGHELRQAAAHALSQRHELRTAEELRAWLARQGLREDQLDLVLADEAQLAWVDTVYDDAAVAALSAYLRVTGRYGALAERARARGEALRGSGLEAPSLADAGLGEDALWAWYFGDHLGRVVPGDLERYARRAGFGDAARMRTQVLRFYVSGPGSRPG